VLDWLCRSDDPIINLDKLTYAGNLENLASLQGNTRHTFIRGDIGDANLVASLLNAHKPRAIINFAAESHVDRSIHGPEDFIQTNILGNFRLLEAVRGYWSGLNNETKQSFRFLHVSTDEVYGSLAKGEPAFSETRRYEPNSPYSASKAASDHLVRASHHTYGLPVLTTNCSNNYGPYQFPEKLIPLMIVNALVGKPLPIYGDGMNVRDWLYVGDHCSGIRAVLARGRVGETYNIGGWNEMPNKQIVQTVCALLDELRPDAQGPHERLITYVTDRSHVHQLMHTIFRDYSFRWTAFNRVTGLDEETVLPGDASTSDDSKNGHTLVVVGEPISAHTLRYGSPRFAERL
jgi:dTDP-glucose 4,6-dehydratase